MPRNVTPSGGVAVVMAVVLGLAALACSRGRADTQDVARLVVKAGDLRSVPASSDEVLATQGAELRRAVYELYQRGFLPVTAKARGEATPAPTPGVEDLFTPAARAAIDRTAFAVGSDEKISRATVEFDGVMTVDGRTATTALLRVRMEARGKTAVGPPGSALRMGQAGQLLFERTPAGWAIAGFDVTLRAERVTPADPAKPREAAARWMP